MDHFLRILQVVVPDKFLHILENVVKDDFLQLVVSDKCFEHFAICCLGQTFCKFRQLFSPSRLGLFCIKVLHIVVLDNFLLQYVVEVNCFANVATCPSRHIFGNSKIVNHYSPTYKQKEHNRFEVGQVFYSTII